jgi:hypothetical protein
LFFAHPGKLDDFLAKAKERKLAKLVARLDALDGADGPAEGRR